MGIEVNTDFCEERQERIEVNTDFCEEWQDGDRSKY